MPGLLDYAGPWGAGTPPVRSDIFPATPPAPQSSPLGFLSGLFGQRPQAPDTTPGTSIPMAREAARPAPGGIAGNSQFGDFMQAAGMSLMTSPRGNMLQNMPQFLAANQERSRERRKEAKAEAGANATADALEKAGFTMEAEALRNGQITGADAFKMLMDSRDPMKKLELEAAQLKIDGLRNPKPEYDYFTNNAGDRLRFDKRSTNGEAEMIYDGPDKAPAKPAEVQAYEYYRDAELAANRPPMSFNDYRLAGKKAGASSTTVSMGGGDNKQVFDAMSESANSARAAAQGINSIRQARSAVEGGGIFGAGADQRLGLQKVGALMGVVDPDAITNTETFRAAIAPQVAAMVKSTVGNANISNADREFAERAAGGSISLDETTITRLLDIMERASSEAVTRHQSILDQVYPKGEGGEDFRRERALFEVQLPVNAPAGAIDALRADPSLADQFDGKYGAGASARVLGGQ